MTLIYSDKHMRADLTAADRITPAQIMDAKRELLRLRQESEIGWLDAIDDKKYIAEINNKAKQFSKFKHLLVIGIGGSSLGARAVLNALKAQTGKVQVHFAGDTTDPDEIAWIFSRLPWKQTAINVISKSGGTLETMSVFFAAKEKLENAVGVKKAAKAIICTTEAPDSSLGEYAAKKGYAVLEIPKNVGGRYSVLSAAGLFPIALSGINFTKILQGARAMRDEWKNFGGVSHTADQFAALHAAHYAKGRPINVLFSYSSALKLFGEWFVQLWAESLGKSPAYGPTPLSAVGPTDQHSLLQLFQQGPDDKVYTFVKVESFNSKLKVPATIKSVEKLKYLSGKKLSILFHAALEGTYNALADEGKPCGVISIKKIDEINIGKLIMFFEISTAMNGLIMNINPFDQPGVEDSKTRVKDILTK